MFGSIRATMEAFQQYVWILWFSQRRDWMAFIMFGQVYCLKWQILLFARKNVCLHFILFSKVLPNIHVDIFKVCSYMKQAHTTFLHFKLVEIPEQEQGR